LAIAAVARGKQNSQAGLQAVAGRDGPILFCDGLCDLRSALPIRRIVKQRLEFSPRGLR
jgi:hypothetical protein